MTRNLLAISFLLPLAFVVGCGDPNNSDICQDYPEHPSCDGTVEDDTGTGGNGDFVAVILATTPFEGVTVTVDGTDAECSGTTCTFEVDEAGGYRVEAWDTYTFIPKVVEVESAGEIQVSWNEGGCASNPDWEGTTECDEWVSGEYGMVLFEGARDCVDEIWGLEADDVEFVVDDEAITIVGISSSYDAIVSGNTFYGSHSSGNWYSGNITDDGAFHVYMTNAVNGTVDEFLFYCD